MCAKSNVLLRQGTRAVGLEREVARTEDGGDLDRRFRIFAQHDIVANLQTRLDVVTGELHAGDGANRYARDRDRVPGSQRRRLQKLRRVVPIPDTEHVDHQHGSDHHRDHRDGGKPKPRLVVALQRTLLQPRGHRMNQPLAMFLHLGVCHALFPGVAALTMIGTTSLRPGKNPKMFTSHSVGVAVGALVGRRE